MESAAVFGRAAEREAGTPPQIVTNRTDGTAAPNLLPWQNLGNADDGGTHVATARMLASRMEASQAETSSAALLDRYAEARAESGRLFDVVAPTALYERPIPERHRIAFYLGHLEAFDGNLFRSNAAGLEPFHPEYDQLFAFGIDPVDGGLPVDQPEDWPAIDEIHGYNALTRKSLDEFLPEFLARGETLCGYPAATLVETAIEHRLMHLETLSYMLHQLPLSQKIRPRRAETSSETPGAFSARSVAVAAGEARLGLASSAETFGWDNEFVAHRVAVPAFSIEKYKVTNGEYLAFSEAGGYRDRDYWAAGDWDWKQRERISHPALWKPVGGQWRYRTMFDEVPLPLDWPVYVSYAEASAYARWAGKRLPSETEWHRAAFGDGEPDMRAEGNFDFKSWDPVPVHDSRQSAGAFGAVGMTGNGWEWTGTPFAPFPGFRAFPFYPGYSANFFDGQHLVMKGASARTAASMARPSFRNWFQRHYQYVYAGFRCVDGPRKASGER